MRDELLDETLFFTFGRARSILARWIDNHNTGRTHYALGNTTPAVSPPNTPGGSWLPMEERRKARHSGTSQSTALAHLGTFSP